MNNDSSFIEYMSDHLTQSTEKALDHDRYVFVESPCPKLSDVDFARLGVMRCLSPVNSGRNFLQNIEEIHGEVCPHSTYFNALKSPRRMEMITALEKQSYALHCEQLSTQGVDYLALYPELDGYTVEAADGHFMDHACHTPKSANGSVYAAGFIYAQNLRNGLLRALCPVTNGTVRHHEIPVLRNHIENQNQNQNQKKTPTEKNLYVYDKAVTDFSWWKFQERHHNYRQFLF